MFKPMTGIQIDKFYPPMDWQYSFPNGYTRLEYIESDGTQYIDTGYVPTENDVIECDVQQMGTSDNGDKYFFAQQNADTSKGGLWVNQQNNNNVWYIRFGSTSSVGGASTTTESNDKIHITLKKESFVSSGGTTFSPSWAGTMQSTPITLFGRWNTAGTTFVYAKLRYWNFQITRNGTLVRNFVPVKRNSDNEIGMFDLVNQVFYPNAGTGSFVAGKELYSDSQQIDIRKNAENNTITLLYGHIADFNKYSLLGLLAQVSSGTYDVYIDDVKVGDAITSNTQYDIDFSTITTSIGTADDPSSITTPKEKLTLHKIVIKPTTSGAEITKFRCIRTTGVTTQQSQGVLWCHFELTNEINIAESFGTGGGNIAEGLLYAITSKGDYIDVGANSIGGMLNGAGRLRHLPLLSSFNFANSGFRGFQALKRVRVVNWNTNNSTYVFYNSQSIEKIDIRKITTSSLATNFFHLNFKLKLLPFKNATPSTTNLTDMLTQDESLFPTKLDFSNLVALTKITSMGGNRLMRGLRGLKVSNEAPFTGASPQINVNYTGLDRDALVELFQSLPTVTGGQTLSLVGATGNNLTKVGSPTIDENGVASGFDSSNYLRFPNFSISDFYELKTKFIVNNLVSNTRNIIGTQYLYSVLGLKISSSNKILSEIKYTLSGSQVNKGSSVDLVLQENTIYYAKVLLKDKKYQVLLSTDDLNWIGGNIVEIPEGATILSPTSTQGQAGRLHIGAGTQQTTFDGSVYLEETYVKNDRNYLMKGYITDTDKAIATDKGWALTLS